MMTRTITAFVSMIVVLVNSLAATAQVTSESPERFVQIREIDFDNQTIEIHNFGLEAMRLDGWRFCTHDEDQVRQYSSASALNGRVLGAGESLFLLFTGSLEDDSTAANEINISSLGNFATPLDTDGAYSIQFYFQTPFGVGANIADHVQVSNNGSDDLVADERSDEAVAGGVWTDENAWVAVTSNTDTVTLNQNVAGQELHGPADYLVAESPTVTTLVDGELMIMGSAVPDDVAIFQFGDTIEVFINIGSTDVFDAADVDRISVLTFGGADIVTADVSVPTMISGGAGADFICGGQAENEIFGGPGADDIFGGPLDDFINSGQGQDFVNALGGDDTILGGDANDTLFAGPGSDLVIAGLGADMVNAGGGDDVVFGNAGGDQLIGGPGNDVLSGAGGPDSLVGGGGDDQLTGGASGDMLNGGPGFDTAVDVGETEVSIEN